MSTLEPGRLRHRIGIDRLVIARDDYGGTVEFWEPVAEAWAEVAPLSGREFIAAQATQAGVTTRIVLRYRAGLTPAMRVRHAGAHYNIRAVLPDPGSGREWVTLMCETGVNEG